MLVMLENKPIYATFHVLLQTPNCAKIVASVMDIGLICCFHYNMHPVAVNACLSMQTL